MTKTILGSIACLLLSFNLLAQNDSTAMVAEAVAKYFAFSDSIEKRLNYQTGKITLGNGIATINVPENFKYLGPEQAQYVLVDLWGNPKNSSSMGMLMPKETTVLSPDAWIFNIQFDSIGYVDDSDAEDIDYDDLLKQLQEEEVAENEERKKAGYGAVNLVGWASQPYYDADKKVLHWAKELKFEGTEPNTLNYNVRVLGRKGVLILNAIAPVDKVGSVKEAVPSVLSMVAFEQGHRYADFNPEVDQVAAWTIGGLVAGKVLAKAGFFAVIAKFWKVIAIAVAGAASLFWRRLMGKKEEA